MNITHTNLSAHRLISKVDYNLLSLLLHKLNKMFFIDKFNCFYTLYIHIRQILSRTELYIYPAAAEMEKDSAEIYRKDIYIAVCKPHAATCVCACVCVCVCLTKTRLQVQNTHDLH